MRKGESGSDVPSDREGRGGEASNREDQKGILTQQSPPPSLPLQLGEIAGEGAAPLPTRPCKRRGGRGGEGTERFVKTLVWGSGEEEKLKNGVALRRLRQKKNPLSRCALIRRQKGSEVGGGGGGSPIKGEGLFFHEPFAAFLPLDTAAGLHAIHARPTCIWNGWARRNSRFQMVVRFSSRLRCTLF